MGREIEPIARIRLSRSLPRLLAWPAILLVVAAGLGVAAFVVGGAAVIGLGATAALVGLVAVWWAARLLSVRLDVEESELRVHWLGGERRYALSPGPVTRVRFRGENASRLRVRRGFLGYGLGPARLRDDEAIHVVRLAPTTTAILVPTEEGRLAIAPDDEAALLEALSRAARARQRLDELARTTTHDGRPHLAVDEAGDGDAADEATEPEPGAAAEPEMSDVAALEAEARPMTGIERMLYERRLAEDRAMDEAEAAAAEAAAAELEAGRRLAGEPEPAAQMIAPEPDASAGPSTRAAAADSRRGVAIRRPRLRAEHTRHAIAFVPLAGAVVAWALGVTVGEMPDPASELGRLTAVALVMAGPASALGVIVARVRWPQIVGVVVMSGLAASVLVGRMLLGA
jgi:hypothetical protein